MGMRTPRKVALLVDTATSYGRGLLRGIARYARLYGPWTLVGEPGGLGEQAARLDLRGVDGILALLRTPAQVRRVSRARVPFLDLDFARTDLGAWPVQNDERGVASLAAAHLADRGFRAFAFCGWSRGEWWEEERLDAYRAAVRRAGGSLHVCSRRDQERLPRWLASLPRPCGLFASNDQRGRHVLEAARAAGVRVPEELAVVGVDDDEVVCEMSSPPLTSVGLDTLRIGFEGAAALDRWMRGRRPSGRPLLVPPTGVVTRQSTDVLAFADPSVASAVRFVRANVARPIAVPDLAAAAGVSRKTLELRFRAALGRTPHEEILRSRLERVRDRLARTDWPLKRIAADSGFTYPEHLHAVFRRREGLTPSAWRRLHRSLQ
jgi:LacI family transcriptional regulator